MPLSKKIQGVALTAMRIYFDSRIIPIFIYEGENYTENGTGICLALEDKYFIISAGHVIKKAYEPNHHLLLVGEGEEPQFVTHFENKWYKEDDISGVDIGYIELSRAEFDKLNKNYIQYNDLSQNISHRNNDITHICGYPVGIVTHEWQNKRNIYTVQAIHFPTYTIDPNHWFDRDKGKTNTLIMLKYPRIGEDKDGKPFNMPDVDGMSGGGIWTQNVQDKSIWIPENAKLFGIIIDWDKDERFVAGIQIQHWVNLIKQDYPTLIT